MKAGNRDGRLKSLRDCTGYLGDVGILHCVQNDTLEKQRQEQENSLYEF